MAGRRFSSAYCITRLRLSWERIQQALIEEVDRHYGVFHGQKFNPRRWAA